MADLQLLKLKLSANDYAAVMPLVNQLLESRPDDELMRIKAYACIKTDRYGEALTVLTLAALKDDSKLDFERAYCLYRLNRLHKSRRILEKSKQSSRRMRLLLAQVLYRLERFDECFKLYQALYDEQPSTEMMINMSAAKAASELVFDSIAGEINNADDEMTYELVYNRACAKLAIGDTPEAVRLLHKAMQVGEASLASEGQSSMDIARELAVVKFQLAYAYQNVGDDRKSRKMYEELLALGDLDDAIKVHAQINLDVMARERTDHVAKLLRSISSKGSNLARLASYQRGIIAYNEALVQYGAGNARNAVRAAKRLCEDAPKLPCAQTLAGFFLKPDRPMDRRMLKSTTTRKRNARHLLPVKLGGAEREAVFRRHLRRCEFEECIAILQSKNDGKTDQESLTNILLALSGMYFIFGNVAEALSKIRALKDKEDERVEIMDGLLSSLVSGNKNTRIGSMEHAKKIISAAFAPSGKHSSRARKTAGARKAKKSLKAVRNLEAKRKPQTGKIDAERWTALRDRSYYKKGKKRPGKSKD